MRLGRFTAVAICAALVGAAPAAAKPREGEAKVKQCKYKQHKRFACERSDESTLIVTCPQGYSALSYVTAPDADVNGNRVVCFAEGVGALDDTP